MYRVQVLPRALKDIADLPKDYARLVGQHIDGLAQEPRPPGAKKLRGTKDHSLRVGTYRILYDIDSEAHFIYAKNLDPRPQDDFEELKFSIGTSF